MNYQVAMKDHICTLCGLKIPKGSKYWSEYREVDGEVIYRKEHTNCELYSKIKVK